VRAGPQGEGYLGVGQFSCRQEMLVADWTIRVRITEVETRSPGRRSARQSEMRGDVRPWERAAAEEAVARTSDVRVDGAAIRASPSTSTFERLAADFSVCAESEGPPPARYAHSTDDSDAPDDPPSPVENVVPFINAPVYAESPEGTATSAHRRADARAPDSETFHRLRARALSLETVEASRSSPRRVPVLPVHRAQFQLPGRTNPFHVLAVKCEPSVCRPNAPNPNPHFAIAVDEEGHAYVSRVDDESFEAVCRFPGRVDETTAEAVYKEGVLFVIARPRKTHAVLVPVETPG